MSENLAIAPFKGVRYDSKKIDLSRVTAPPYDVISSEGQKKLYERDAHNIIRLILGYQFPNDTDQNNRYTRAAADFHLWREDGTLIRDEQPSLYLYEQTYEVPGKGRLARRGFLGLRKIEEFGKGLVKPHEKTLAGPKQDRLLLTKACGANLSPIFSLYSDPEKKLPSLQASFFQQQPLLDFKDDDGVGHKLWRVVDAKLFEETNKILSQRPLFIADGHHRYETSINYRNFMKEKYPNAPENASFNYVMMFFSEISDPGLLVFPTHRVLHHWKKLDATALKKQIREKFEVATFADTQRKEFLNVLQNPKPGTQSLGFIIRDQSSTDYWVLSKKDIHSVATQILHHEILGPMLGMSDEEQKDPNYIDFFKDTGDMTPALESIGKPETQCVFLLNPPTMDSLEKVVQAGEILPPKSTYFYPKLLSGLVLNQIDPDGRVEI